MLCLYCPITPKDQNKKLEKYEEGVRNRPDIRFIPFAVTEFGVLGGHAMAFFIELARQATASTGCMWANCWPPDAERFSHRPCRPLRL
jgi:hypothetical protein